MNKVLYAREGARSIMDRTFEDFPWQVRVEVDGVDIEVPEVNHIKLVYIIIVNDVTSLCYIFEGCGRSTCCKHRKLHGRCGFMAE